MKKDDDDYSILDVIQWWLSYLLIYVIEATFILTPIFFLIKLLRWAMK